MKVKFEPSFLKGELKVPPSKSLLHRAIICASLSHGTSIIKNINYSKDILATIEAFKNAGINIEEKEKKLIITSNGKLNLRVNVIDCNESGSTLRFLIPLFSSLETNIIFTGKESLMKRPLFVYKNIYEKHDCSFILDENRLSITGSLKSGEFNIPGNISSQFISGLLFYLPTLNEKSKINIIGDLESRDYIDMTIDMLKKFGVHIYKIDNSYIIPGQQYYKARNIEIESDFSQMAFFAVAGIISGNITCKNINLKSLQGDKEIIKIIANSKGNITYQENNVIIKKSETSGLSVDVSQCPDLGPILGVLLSLSKGKSVLYNAKRLVMKESNRLEATYVTLKKLGVNCNIENDSLIINGTNQFLGGEFDSFNDHRIAMMIAIASLRAKDPIILNNAEAINKSYPAFYEDFKSLGGKMTVIKE